MRRPPLEGPLPKTTGFISSNVLRRDDNDRPWRLLHLGSSSLYIPKQRRKFTTLALLEGAAVALFALTGMPLDEYLAVPIPPSSELSNLSNGRKPLNKRHDEFHLNPGNQVEPIEVLPPVIEKRDEIHSNPQLEEQTGCADRSLAAGKLLYSPSGSPVCHAEQMMQGGYRTYCKFGDLRLDPTKFSSAAVGGEKLVDVMGQKENDEYLTYRSGAFASPQKTSIPDVPREDLFFLNDVLDSIVVVGDREDLKKTCLSFVPGATLFIQRYEYVNLYHTMTDWWNTWTVYRQMESGQIASTVFLDAHPAGTLDVVWETMFGKFDRVNLRFRDSTCFESAYMIPAGYRSHLTQSYCAQPSAMDEFVDFVLQKFELQHIRKIPGRVVIIDRRPYISHPRSSLGHARSREIDNLEQMATWMTDEVPSMTSVNIIQLHNMTFRDQVQAVRESEILIGNHGAGLTHLVFTDNESLVVEFGRSVECFAMLATWKNKVLRRQLPQVDDAISRQFFDESLLPSLTEIYSTPWQQMLDVESLAHK